MVQRRRMWPVVAMALLVQACAGGATPGAPTAAPTSAPTTGATSAPTGSPVPSPLGAANIRSSFPADGRYCYMWLAKEKGYYAAQNLEMTVEEGANSTQVMQTVASGQDFMSNPSVNLLPIAKSTGATVKAVAMLEQEHPAGVVVHGSGPIQNPAQLAGKSINVGPGDAFTLLPAFLKANNVDVSSVTINNTDHATKLQTFLAGKGDAATIFSEGELPVIRKQDPTARFFPYSQVFQMYGLGLVVSESTIAQRPAAVRAAVKAVLDAELYALDHPEECVDAIVKAYPNKTFDRGIELERLKEHQKLLVAAGRDKIGQMTDDRWRTLEAIIVQYFNIQPSNRPMSFYYTNEFLPKG